jgi:hypothetical protein
MTLPENLTSLRRDALLALVVEQQRQIVALTALTEALRAAIEPRKRSAKRQATPFSQGTHVTPPQRPGRQPGSGPFPYRTAPLPEQITEPPVDVPVTLEACPDCGGGLEEVRVDLAYTTDLPALPRPTVTQYRVSGCQGTRWGRPGRGQHPAIAPDQYGATAHRLGDRAMAAAHGLP